MLWVEHLEQMEYLRSSVNLRAYGQRDPLVEYKKEGLRLFNGLEASFTDRVRTIMTAENAPAQQAGRAVEQAARSIAGGGRAVASLDVGRNDKVVITNGSETKEMKFKKAEPLIASGEWRIVGR